MVYLGAAVSLVAIAVAALGLPRATAVGVNLAALVFGTLGLGVDILRAAAKWPRKP